MLSSNADGVSQAANQEFVYSYSFCLSGGVKVPKIYRYFRINNIGYIAMEFVEGISLQEIPLQDHLGLVQRLATA
jgi:RIO-like serine/threonine protein kinase